MPSLTRNARRDLLTYSAIARERRLSRGDVGPTAGARKRRGAKLNVSPYVVLRVLVSLYPTLLDYYIGHRKKASSASTRAVVATIRTALALSYRATRVEAMKLEWSDVIRAVGMAIQNMPPSAPPAERTRVTLSHVSGVLIGRPLSEKRIKNLLETGPARRALAARRNRK
jgi:hypothetical protein